MGSCKIGGTTGPEGEADAAAGDLGAAAGEAASGRLVVVAVCTGAGNECNSTNGVEAGVAVLSALTLVEEETAQLFAFDAEESLCFFLAFFKAQVVELGLGATSKAHHDYAL